MMVKNKRNKKGGLVSPADYAKNAATSAATNYALKSVDPTGNLSALKGQAENFDPTKQMASLKENVSGQLGELKDKIPKMPEVNLGEMGDIKNIGDLGNKAEGFVEELVDSGMEKLNEGAAYVGEILTNPETQEKVGEAAKNVAESAAHILRVAEPGIAVLAKEGEQIAETSLKPAIRATGSAIKDLFEAVPGAPLVFEAIDLGTAGLAAASVGVKTFTGLMKAADAISSGAKNSISGFNATNAVIPSVSKFMPKSNDKPAEAAGGGRSRTYKSRSSISKKRYKSIYRGKSKKSHKGKNKTKKRVRWSI
jgi:polyhydroxyalkanoate synthesis regulator phasin